MSLYPDILCENDGNMARSPLSEHRLSLLFVPHALRLPADTAVEACHSYGLKAANRATAESGRDRGEIRGRHTRHQQGGP